MYEKKKWVMVAWFFIVIILFGLLFFLLFNSNGLEIKVQQTESLDEFEVTVSNNSQHVIHSVTVLQQNNETKTIGNIPVLLPKENKTFRIPVQESKITVLALAPFHKTAVQSLFLEPKKPFEISIQKPNRMTVNNQFEISIQICNQSKETGLSIQENHDASFFGNQDQNRELAILTGECKKTVFSFTALLSGRTQIAFNIKSATLSEQSVQELVIGT